VEIYDSRQQGSALVVVMLAAVVIVMIGTAHLMMTQTESRIAGNETRAVQARFAAEAAARAVKLWFERPGSAPAFPSPQSVVRARTIVDELDPYGSSPRTGGPQYKEGVDLDADGLDDLFAPPYRGGLIHALMGSAQAPDVRVDDPRVLEALSLATFGSFPDVASGVRARVERVDIYAPPYLRAAGGWVRHGVGTVEVVATIERDAPGGAVTLARRSARMVLAEVPYTAPLVGAVHACGDAELIGDLGVAWGAMLATGRLTAGTLPPASPGLPRALPGTDGVDRLWTDDATWVAAFNAGLDPAGPIEDPWLRVIAGGAVSGAPSTDAQPWAGGTPPPVGAPPPWSCCDGSNVMQHQDWLSCPDYPYIFWKRAARSGLRGARYFSWNPVEGFREDGRGPGLSFAQLFDQAAGEAALWFFDTADGRAPRDDDGDGTLDNLTPEILVEGGWGGRGFVFLNAERLVLSGLVDTLQVTLRAPGEPHVAGPDAWIDLIYPDQTERPFFPAGGGIWDARGPAVTSPASFRGLLVTNGDFATRGGGLLYGAVVARGVELDGSAGSATRIVHDAGLETSWPPAAWFLPRFVVSSLAIE